MTTNEINEMLTKWRQIHELSDSVVGDLSCALDVAFCPYEECDNETVKYLIKSAEKTIKIIKEMLDK